MVVNEVAIKYMPVMVESELESEGVISDDVEIVMVVDIVVVVVM